MMTNNDGKNLPPSLLVTKGVNKFGSLLFKDLEKSKNLVFSPFSLSTALAMLTPGAKEKTLAQVVPSSFQEFYEPKFESIHPSMLAWNWNTSTVVSRLKKHFHCPLMRTPWQDTGLFNISKTKHQTHQHITLKEKEGSIRECSRCFLPTFQSQEFTLSTANRIFLKKGFKPKKRYIIHFICQL